MQPDVRVEQLCEMNVLTCCIIGTTCNFYRPTIAPQSCFHDFGFMEVDRCKHAFVVQKPPLAYCNCKLSQISFLHICEKFGMQKTGNKVIKFCWKQHMVVNVIVKKNWFEVHQKCIKLVLRKWQQYLPWFLYHERPATIRHAKQNALNIFFL